MSAAIAEPKIRVLVVEDDMQLAEITAEAIREEGFEVVLAYRARAALEILRTFGGIDLVFSDIMMPEGMNGLQLARIIRDEFPDLPVLLTTGYSSEVTPGGTPGWPLITKPYRVSEVCVQMQTMVAGDSVAERENSVPR